MALNLGELYGTIGLEDSPFNDALDGALVALKGWASKGAVVAGAAGLTIAAAVGTSIVAGMNLEAGRDRLAAELGLSEADSARIGKVAGELFASNYGDSIENVNEAIAAVRTSISGMADASNKDLKEAAITAMNFADVFDIDINRAAQVAGQAVKSGLAKNATEAFDLLIAASQQVPKNLREDVLDASDEYAQFFSTLGYSGKEAFSMLVSQADKGAYGIDKAGDAIKEFTIRSTDMSTASGEAYTAIGLDAGEMANKILKGGKTARSATQEIIDGLLGIKDPAAQGQAAIALFGTPLEDLNATEIPAFLTSLKGGGKAMDDAGGAAKRLDKTLNDNAISSLSSLKRQAQVAFYSLGNWALPTVNKIAASLSANFGPALAKAGDALGILAAVGQDVFGFLAEHQTTVTIIAGIIAALLVPALIAWGVQSAIAGALSVAAWLGTATGAVMSAGMQVISLTLITAGWMRMGIQSLLSAARVAAAWLIAMGPIGIAIALIGLIVVAVVKNWDTIKSKTKAVWDWVVSKVKAVPGLLVGFFMNFTLPGLIIKHFDKIKSTVSGAVSSVVGYMKSLPGKMLRAVGNLGSLLGGVGRDLMRGLRDGIEDGLSWVRDKLSGVGRLIPGWLKKVLGISSPSKVMRDQVGKWLPAGVAEGIEAGLPGLRRSVEAMGDATITPITAAPSFAATANRRSATDLGQAAEAAMFGTTPAGADRGPLIGNVYQTPGQSADDLAEMLWRKTRARA